MSSTDEADVQPPGTGQVTRRALATAVVIGLLLAGSAWGDDDWFPFGPMSQFAGRIAADSTIRTLWVEVTPEGQEPRRLDLTNADEIGLKGIELRRQLERFTNDPLLLAQFADAWAELHPERPPLVKLVIGQDRTKIEQERIVDRRSKVVATWTAP